MKLLTALCALFLLPNVAIAQVNRTVVDNKVSNLGNITANSDREASRLCAKKGGNVVIRLGDRWYSCHYARQLANK